MVIYLLKGVMGILEDVKIVYKIRFMVKARNAQGPFLPSGDGMLRAMALVEAISHLKLEENSIAVTLIEGKNLDQVDICCMAKTAATCGQEYLEDVAEQLCQNFDCSYASIRG